MLTYADECDVCCGDIDVVNDAQISPRHYAVIELTVCIEPPRSRNPPHAGRQTCVCNKVEVGVRQRARDRELRDREQAELECTGSVSSNARVTRVAELECTGYAALTKPLASGFTEV